MSARDVIAEALDSAYSDNLPWETIVDAFLSALAAAGYRIVGPGFELDIDDRVTKKSGSKWTGPVVGFYSTSLTPAGYAIESETETGSVQIYPAAAIRAMVKP